MWADLTAGKTAVLTVGLKVALMVVKWDLWAGWTADMMVGRKDDQ